MNNGIYWQDKNDRAQIAVEHTNYMDLLYKDQINESIKNTKVHGPGNLYLDINTALKESNINTAIYVCNAFTCDVFSQKYDSDIELGLEPNSNTAILNFASYKNPGGMFLKGSSAQEEYLCHHSFLYNVLSTFNEYYEWNCKNLHKALYTNRALYSPNIYFIVNGIVYNADVITCAAPNKSAAIKYKMVTEQENSNALDSRIKFVLDVAAYNNVDNLVLGAYGCGVFGQDANEVASIFKKYLLTTHKNLFKRVIFAVPSMHNDYNLSSFIKVFSDI